MSSSSPSTALIQTRSSTLPTSSSRSDYQVSFKSLKVFSSLDSSFDTWSSSLVQTASVEIWPSSISSVSSDILPSSLTSQPSNYQSFLTPTLNTTASQLLESEISGSIMRLSIDLLKDKTMEFTQAASQFSISVSSVPVTDEIDASTFPKSSSWNSHTIYAQNSSYIAPVLPSLTALLFSTTTHAAGLSGSVFSLPSSPTRSVIALDTVASRASLEQTTSLASVMKGSVTFSSKTENFMLYSSIASGASTKQPLINLSSSQRTSTATTKHHATATFEAQSQGNRSQSAIPTPSTSIEASDYNQYPSFTHVEEPILTDMTSSTRAIHPTSINKVSESGFSLSTLSTMVVAVSIANARLLSTGPISAKAKTIKPFASMLSVHPYRTEIERGSSHSSVAMFSIGNAPSPLSTLATESTIDSERVLSKTPFISKLKSSMLESHRNAVSPSSKNPLLEYSATTAVPRPLLESAEADSRRIHSIESSVLEVNEYVQTKTEASFEANSQIQRRESSRVILETAYPSEKQISAIEYELDSHTAKAIHSLVSESSFEKSAVQSTKYQRMSVTKDSSLLSPTNNESKIMTVEILPRSEAIKNISAGSISSLFNSNQTITQLNTNNHTIRPSPSSSTGTTLEAFSSSSSVAAKSTISGLYLILF